MKEEKESKSHKKELTKQKKLQKKHKILSNFFIKILNIEENLANKNACKIEHVIDDELIEKIALYTQSHE